MRTRIAVTFPQARNSRDRRSPGPVVSRAKQLSCRFSRASLVTSLCVLRHNDAISRALACPGPKRYPDFMAQTVHLTIAGRHCPIFTMIARRCKIPTPATIQWDLGTAAIGDASTSALKVCAAPAVLSRSQNITISRLWTSFTGDLKFNAIHPNADSFNVGQPDRTIGVVQVPSQSETDITKLMTAARGVMWLGCSCPKQPSSARWLTTARSRI